MTVSLDVAVDVPLAAGDSVFTYLSPGPVAPGTPVVVPFRTRLTLGYVLDTREAEADRARGIIGAMPGLPSLPPELITLARRMASHYLCSAGEALAAMLPPGLFGDVRVRLSGPKGASLDGAAHLKGPVALRRLARVLGPGAPERLRELIGEGALRLEGDLPSPGDPAPARRKVSVKVDPLLWPVPGAEGHPRRVLLIGSPREGPYLAAVKDALETPRSALLLFATVLGAERFADLVRDVLGVPVVAFHGDLSPEERLRRWLDVLRGAVRVVAGTRSAVFAPLPDIGLIAVDDEADAGHKEERVPRYHAREVARWRAGGADLILSDQAPSTDAWAGVVDGALEVIRIGAGDNLLPASIGTGPRSARVIVVDLRRPRKAPEAPRPSPTETVLSPPLVTIARNALREGGNVVLFASRKGYAGFVLCRECGLIPLCARCQVPMAFEVRGRVLRCRYCRDRKPAPSVCPNCGGRSLTARGIGTERLAQIARKELGAVVWRLDTDVARTPQAAAEIVRRHRQEGGVLVATPMVFHLPVRPEADIVGVILAESALRHPDYRAAERGMRTLWLLRALARSTLVLQTYVPDHAAVIALRRNDLRLFYRDELEVRRAFHYPPHGEVVTLDLSGPEEAAKAAARRIGEAGSGAGTEVLGPARLRGGAESRWTVMFKGPTVPRQPIAALLRAPLTRRVRVSADVDP